MSIATTTDANGRLLTASSGGVDTSALVVLDPATSVRNVIAPTTVVKALTIRGETTNTEKPFRVLRGSDGFEMFSCNAANADTTIWSLTCSGGLLSSLLWADNGAASDLNLQNSRVLVKGTGAANARLVVTGDVGQTAPVFLAQTSGSSPLFTVASSGIVTLVHNLIGGGDISVPVGNDFICNGAGRGLTVKSPDGLTTKKITIDNAGVLALI